jgi:hypothetical protein
MFETIWDIVMFLLSKCLLGIIFSLLFLHWKFISSTLTMWVTEPSPRRNYIGLEGAERGEVFSTAVIFFWVSLSRT